MDTCFKRWSCVPNQRFKRLNLIIGTVIIVTVIVVNVIISTTPPCVSTNS